MKSSVWTTPIPLPAALSLPISSAKEIRAIVPVLLGAIAIGLFAMLAGYNGVVTYVFLLYPLACCAIGALAFGHDYTHRTLATFLALPISRSKIWRRRLTFSLCAMLPLAVFAITSLYFPMIWAAISGRDVSTGSSSYVLHYIAQTAFVPILSGLFLAPWLTLVSRSPLFGTLISFVAPFLIGLIWSRLLLAMGYEQPNTFWQQLDLFPMGLLSMVFGILGWRKFHNLEVIDGEIGAFSRSPKKTTAATEKIQRHSPTLQLFKKDLMLLRMPIALSAAGMLLTFFLNKEQAALWTLIYPAMIFLLICAVASADERQLGVAEWQMLVPVAFYKQWMIKFFVTWSTALVVGLALPVTALFYKTGEMQKIGSTDLLQVTPVLLAASFQFVALTLYVSSLCNSGLKALITAILVNVSASYAIIQSFEAYSKYLRTERITGVIVTPELAEWWLEWEYWPLLIAIFGIAVLALILAMRNHRYAERGAGRILRQLIAFAGYEAAAALAIVTFWNWYTWLR